MERRRKGLLAVLLLGMAALAPPGAADEAAAVTQEQLEDVRKQVYELNKLLRQLELQQEEDKKVAADNAKKQAVVSAGPDGFRITSSDKAYELRLRLRLAYDLAWFKQDRELEQAVGDEQDGAGFRFARIVLAGKLATNIQFNGEFDFAGEPGEEKPKFRDVYFDYTGIPYGGERGLDFRVGHFREPISLEEITPVSDRVFIERSLPNVFIPSRNGGLQLADSLLGEPKKERLHWAIGIFKETDDIPSANDGDEDQGWQVTARVTGLPYYKNDGRQLVHLGAAASLRNPDGARVNYGARPESRLALFRYADPDRPPAPFRLRDARADDVLLTSVEAATVLGPFSAQAEYTRSDVETTFGGDATFDGWYAQAGYVLTGEHRAYRHDRGAFGTVTPAKPFGFGDTGGWGAWEVAARYSQVDLNDGIYRGGEHEAYTLGLNWFLNKNLRLFANYIHNEVDTDLYDGDFDSFQVRFQLDF